MNAVTAFLELQTFFRVTPLNTYDPLRNHEG